jgi:hypothetical protein
LLTPRFSLVIENLALRQQLVVLRRHPGRPELRNRDRLFWVALSHLWREWHSILVIVKPETVIKWLGRASSAIGVGSPDLVGSAVRGLIFLLRDRDLIYGKEFRSRVAGMGIEEVITRAQSPWQNPYAERLIGSMRRECLDHLIVLNERQLRRILREIFAYYNEVRPHQSVEMNAPVAREVELPAKGKIISLPQVGGLHHRYLRAA